MIFQPVHITPADRTKVQSVRITEELFLPDSKLREILDLPSGTIILDVKRASNKLQLGLPGCLVVVLKGGT